MYLIWFYLFNRLFSGRLVKKKTITVFLLYSVGDVVNTGKADKQTFDSIQLF